MGPRDTSEDGFGGCFAVGGEPFFRLGRRSSDFLIFDRYIYIYIYMAVYRLLCDPNCLVTTFRLILVLYIGGKVTTRRPLIK